MQQENVTFDTEWMSCSGEHVKKQEHIKNPSGSTSAG